LTALRAPTEADVPEVARIMSEHWPEPVDEDLVRVKWSSPSFDLERDARLESEAYGDVHLLGNDRAWIDLRGRPSRELLDWAEARAFEMASRSLAGSWMSDASVRAELDRRGFRVVRYGTRMRRELGDAIPDTVWPTGVRVRSFREGDERVFYELHQETFADTWEPVVETFADWVHDLTTSLSFDPRLWFLASDGDSESAGFAICKVHPGEADLGWVQLLGVRRQWRGRGLARALLLHSFREFRLRGLHRAGLGVDAESTTGAVQLYESAGMTEVARFEIREKVSG
jgi:ribosomal protein S18 acetylase RimI-like enzyme